MSADTPREAPRALPNWAFYAALVVIFVAPSQMAYARDHKNGPFIGYADVLAGIVCLAALVTVLARWNWRALVWPPLAAWALVAVSALSVTQAQASLSGAVVETVQWGLYLVAVYTLFVNVLTDRRRLKLALLTLAVSVTLVVLWALTQYPTAQDMAAVSAGFLNRNTYSAFLALVLPLVLAAALRGRGTGSRVWCVVAAVLGMVTMLSGPLVWVTLISLALVALACRGRERWITLAALVAFVALMPLVLPRNYYAAVTEQQYPYEAVVLKSVGSSEEPIVKKRWLEWVPALRMISANPVLGVGAGNYQANIGQFYKGGSVGGRGATLPNVKKSEPDANNLYLVIAGSMGFCGLAALVGILGYFYRRSRELRGRAEDPLGRILAAGLPASLVALMLGNLFTPMFVRGLSLVIILLFALAEAGMRVKPEEAA